MLAELTALGLQPRLEAFAGHSKLVLVPMADGDRLACSAGSITRAESYAGKFRAVPSGIFCEKTFGREETERRTKFGHIQLPGPIVPWIFHMTMPDGGPSILSRVLNIDDIQISGLLEHQLWLDEHGDIRAASVPSPKELTGSLAIDQLLRAMPNNALPTWLRSLPEPDSAFVAHTILLVPPDLRPVVLLENGDFATSDLNGHYCRVIDRANCLRKRKYLNAPEAIVRDGLRMLQRAADCLFANTFLPEASQTRKNRQPLEDLLNIALMRLRDEEKRTDYSARARAVPLLAAKPDTILVPRSLARTLGVRPRMPILVTRPPQPGEFATPILPLRTGLHDEAVLGMHPDSYDALFRSPAGISECILHRPVTPAAIAEARARVGRVQIAATPPRASWMDESDPRVLLGKLLDASTSGARLSFDSPGGILLAGVGSAKFSTTDQPAPALRNTAPAVHNRSIEIPISWKNSRRTI